MRKLIIAFTALLFSQFSFGQTVQDNATIPVSVTLNSILRLQVKTGGNIQFVFNTMDQYNAGIPNSPGTTTTFTVASSKDFTVAMGSEDDALYGVETGDRATTSGSIPLDVIQYKLGGTGVGTKGAALYPLLQMTATPDVIIPLGLAGAANAARTYEILWEAGTLVTNRVINLPADVYVTNVFINLQPR